MSLNKELKKLILLYLAFVLGKVVLGFFISSPSALGDEYLYSKIARNLFEYSSSLYHGDVLAHKYLPLYPLFLSIGYLFSNMEVVYFVMKVVNAFLSSAIIFPVYYLAREFLESRKAFVGAFLVSIFVANFNVFAYLMSENLFYPLFMLFVFLVYFAFKTDNKWLFLISGIVLALAYWVRVLALVLIPVVFVVWLFRRTKFVNLIWHYGFALLCVIPIFFRNVGTYGGSAMAVTGGYGGPLAFMGNFMTNPLGFFNWIALYFAYALIATGFIFGFYFLLGLKVKDKDFKLLYMITGISFIVNVLVIANQANGSDLLYNSPFFPLFSNRPIGRYFDMTLSLVLLVGYISFEKFEFKEKFIKFAIGFSSLILLLGTQLTIAALFPFNNMALSLLGVLDLFLEWLFYGSIFLEFTWLPFIIIACILFIIPYTLLLFRKNKNLVFYLGAGFIVLTTVVSFCLISFNAAHYWGDSDQAELGHWFNENVEGNVLLDERFVSDKLTKYTLNEELFNVRNEWSLFGFWVNEEIRVGSPYNIEGFDYLVSMDENLGYDIIKKEGDFILYELK